MTREEFLRGWLLLTTQPWGKAYRTSFQASIGEPSPAEIQIEFYYQQLGWYDAASWVQVSTQQAMGERWPSIDSLHLALKQLQPKRKALPEPSAPTVTMHEALAEDPAIEAMVKRILSDKKPTTDEYMQFFNRNKKPIAHEDMREPWPWQTDAERERRLRLMDKNNPK